MKTAEAKQILLNNVGIDRIIETHKAYDYVQFIVSRGGDICTYRIYDDGDTCEK